MFKFDFKLEDTDVDDGIGEDDDNQQATEKNIELQSYALEEIKACENHFENIGLYKLNATSINLEEVKFYFLKTEFVLTSLSKTSKTSATDITVADSYHSDLLPGIYEGGAKIWECTDDLLSYFIKNKFEVIFKDKSILDLGCGAGLLGIYAIKLDASIVHFQDYNKDVLGLITIPNVMINLTESKLNSLNENFKFCSGDWSNFIKFEENNNKFDIILTAETIYNSSNQLKLLNTFDAKLKENGVVLLAAKTYYFGVGGSLRKFEELIKKDGRFTSKVVWNSENGVCREILDIRRL